MSEILTFKSSLPHEAAEGVVGGRIGGTAPAVRIEAHTNADHAKKLIHTLIEDADPALEAHSILDTPEPYEGYIPQVDNVERINYPTPTDEEGEVLQQWDMTKAFIEDDKWMATHIEPFMRPGRKIFIDHHTVGMAVGAHLAELMHAQRGDALIGLRAHSAFLAMTKQVTPEYYEERYAHADGTQRLWDAQKTGMEYADFILFPTEIEKQRTIEAVTSEGIMNREEIEAKSITSGIPLDLTEFAPDDEQGTRRLQEIEIVNGLIDQNYDPKVSFIGSKLQPEDKYLASIVRLDHEKRPWETVDAYIDYLQENWSSKGDFAKFLLIGGLSNKLGIAEKHTAMLNRLKSLPPELQEYFIVTGFPIAHNVCAHIPTVVANLSGEEGFNISEKQSRAAGILVALTPVVGHVGTGVYNEPGKTDTALWTPITTDWTQMAHVFEAARNPDQYRHIAEAGYQHAQQFSAEAVCGQLIVDLNQRFPGFFQKNGKNNLHQGVSL